MENFSHEELCEVKSKRGGRKILYAGYAYNLRYSGKEKLIWRCRVENCSAKLHTNLDGSLISIKDHNHDADFEKNKFEFAYSLSLKRAEETAEPSRTIIFDMLKDYSNEALEKIPDMFSIRDRIKRIRNGRHIYSTPDKTDILNSVKYLPTGELFVQFDSGIEDKEKVVILCTLEILVYLENIETILMDGTFKFAPSKFKQLYTLVAFINTKYIPLVFILMLKKNEASYKKICDFILEKAPGFNPKCFNLDFELAPRKAFKTAFPAAVFYGCNFHFSQIIYRKVQELKMSTLFQNDIEFKLNIRSILALSFVKPDKVLTYFILIKEKLMSRNDKERYEKVLGFVFKNYIDIDEEEVLFWNVYERAINKLPRTTNSLEGFHRSLDNLFTVANPDLGFFGERLHEEHLLSRQKLLRAYYKSFKVNKLSKNYIKEKNIYDIVSNFDTLDPLDYLFQVSLTLEYPFSLLN